MTREHVLEGKQSGIAKNSIIPMSEKLKIRTYKILEIASSDDEVSKIWDVFIILLIALNVLAVTLESVASLHMRFGHFFHLFDIISVSIFSIEYLLRIWSITVVERFSNPIMGRLRFAMTPLVIIDLLAILPFYLPAVFPIDLRFLRALRLFRIFRLFKIGRYTGSIRIIGLALKNQKEQLLITLFAGGLLLTLASGLMYYIEYQAQPEVFSSIPASMWWGIITLTTIGYGDMYPITPIGKLVGGSIALLGVGMVALPAGILASGFAEQIKKDGKPIVCPHCQRKIEK